VQQWDLRKARRTDLHQRQHLSAIDGHVRLFQHCGACGHDCLGGTCSGSPAHCGPGVVVSGAGPDVYVIGVDTGSSGNIYYQGDVAGLGINAFPVSKIAQSGSGTALDIPSTSVEYLGIIGTKLFFDLEGGIYMCNSTGGTQTNVFVENTSAFVASFFAFGDTVYWIQDETDSTLSNPDSTVYSVSASASFPTAKRLTGSIAPSTYKIIDANALSLLFTGPAGLYRVALPDGDAAHDPQLVVGPASSSGSVIAATEDGAGVYWFEYDGTLYGS